MSVFIYDFEDSFTYNIAAEIKKNYSKVEVIPFKNIQEHFQLFKNSQKKAVVILGPGPGHPDDYSWLQTIIEHYLQKPNIFLMGICLGHQLILQKLGAQIAQAKRPRHGIQKFFKVDVFWKKYLQLKSSRITVQVYNSLEVILDKQRLKELKKTGFHVCLIDGVVVMLHKERLLTYQFHPESIGTSYPQSYFRPILNFLL